MLLLALAALSGCAPPARQSWLDQRQAEGACFEVDLADGLDETSTQELRDLYDCLNQGGNLAPLGGVVDALEAPTRAGLPAGVEVAGLVNDLLHFGVDLLSLAGDIAAWLVSDEAQVDEALDLSLELIYGQPWAAVRGGQVSLNTGAALDAGLVRPALPAARGVAGALLDEDLAPLEVLRSAVDSELSIRALHTAAAILGDADLTDTVASLPAHFGRAITLSRSPENDLWTDASGDSVRDLLELLLFTDGADGRSALAQLSDPLLPILDDDQTRSRLRDALATLADGGSLEALPQQLVALISEDTWGAPLTPGGDSAMIALLRLLNQADGPMTCRVELDLLPGSWDDLTLLELSVDNLAETLLDTIAGWDPDQVTGGVDFLGGVLGLSMTDAALYAIADQGTCDRIDRQLVDDLHALDRFNDPDTPDLLPLLLQVLAAVHDPDGSHDRIPELVDLAGALRAGAARPAEEALRDLGESELVADLFALLPVLLDPEAALDTRDFPAGIRPLDFDGVSEILSAALSPDPDGRSPVDRLTGPLSAALVQQGTWDALGNLATLLEAPGARAADLQSWVLALSASDPLLSATREGLAAATDPERLIPALRVAEVPELLDAVGRTELTNEGPLPGYARLVTDGTLDDLMRLLDGLI